MSIRRTVAPGLALAVLLAARGAAGAEKLKPESLVRSHLEQGLGRSDADVGARRARGACRLTAVAVGTGALAGSFQFNSDPLRSTLTMQFGTGAYEGETFAFDGKSVQVGFGQRATSNRSVLGRFVATNDVILREGLLGGVLNARWSLLALQARGAKLDYEGLKKLDGKELHRLRYRAKKGQNDLEIFIYLEPDTFRHLATVYNASRAQDFTSDPIASSRQSDVYYRMEERFADFKPQGGVTLPSRWKIRYETSASASAEWNYELTVDSFEETAPAPAPAFPGARGHAPHDTEDLRLAVQDCRGGQASEDALAGWTLRKAASAVQGLKHDHLPTHGWTEMEVLTAALLLTARGQAELAADRSSTPWFDAAREVLDAVPDRARRRSLQRDWTLAVAALYNARLDGGSSRVLLDRAVQDQPQEPELLLADARLHEAIAPRAYSGLGEVAPVTAEQEAQPDLLTAAHLYQRLIQLEPDRAEARLRCGRVLSLLGRRGEARALLQPLRQQPAATDVPCLAALFLGVVLEQENRGGDALACYQAALASGRSPQAARLAIARALRGAGDTVRARAVVAEMLDGGPAAGDAWARYQAEGFGEASDHAARFAALWQEARR